MGVSTWQACGFGLSRRCDVGFIRKEVDQGVAVDVDGVQAVIVMCSQWVGSTWSGLNHFGIRALQDWAPADPCAKAALIPNGALILKWILNET